MSDETYGDAGLRLLFAIQEACPEAGIASGLRLGAEILLKEYKDAKLEIDAMKPVIQAALVLWDPMFGATRSSGKQGAKEWETFTRAVEEYRRQTQSPKGKA